MIRRSSIAWALMLTVVLVVGAVACNGSLESPAGPTTSNGSGDTGGSGGSSGPSTPGMARLTLAITDSPFEEADAVIVAFDGVSVHRSEFGWEDLPLLASPRVCDLKKLEGPTDILGVATLPAGHYTQIRLSVVDAAIYFDSGPSGGAACGAIAPAAGDVYPVEISSGEIKLNRQFTLEEGSNMMIKLDFDGDKSIRENGNGNGNGGGNGNGNGKSNGRGGNPSADEEDETPERGRFRMSPVIGVVSVGEVPSL